MIPFFPTQNDSPEVDGRKEGIPIDDAMVAFLQKVLFTAKWIQDLVVLGSSYADDAPATRDPGQLMILLLVRRYTASASIPSNQVVSNQRLHEILAHHLVHMEHTPPTN